MDSDPSELLDRLVEDGILVETDDGVILEPGEAFQQQRREWLERVGAYAEDEFRAEAERFDVDAKELERETVADAHAVLEFSSGYDTEQALRVAVVLERLEDPPRPDGIPEGFVPLDDEEVQPFIDQHRVAIVYWWGIESEPCKLVKGDFEELLEAGTIPDEIGLAAVFAADCSDVVLERFQIGAVPTTLFCMDGRVDARLLGAHPVSSLENEIGVLAEHC